MCASSCFGAMSDETDVRPGVGGAVRYGYVILTTYHTYLDLSSITDTGYFGYYSITHTIVCVILAKKQYHISIHGYYNVHGTPGFNGSHTHLQPPGSKRPVSKPRTHPCNTHGPARPMPDLAASERRAKLAMQARPQTRQGVRDVGFSEAQQPAAVLDHKEDRRAHDEHHYFRRTCEPYTCTQPLNHSHVLRCSGRGRCAAHEAPELVWMVLVSGHAIGSTLETMLSCLACEHGPAAHSTHVWASPEAHGAAGCKRTARAQPAPARVFVTQQSFSRSSCLYF